MSISTIELSNKESVWSDPNAKSIAYFCQRYPIRIDHKLIGELKAISDQNKTSNIRLCLHESPKAAFHEMLIVEHPGKHYPPHRHETKGESYHVIEGSMAIFIFDNEGAIIDSCVLTSEENFMYRIGPNMIHAVLPLTDRVVYHESKPGPFLGETDSIYPSWAPNRSNQAELTAFVARLRAHLKKEHRPQ